MLYTGQNIIFYVDLCNNEALHSSYLKKTLINLSRKWLKKFEMSDERNNNKTMITAKFIYLQQIYFTFFKGLQNYVQ